MTTQAKITLIPSWSEAQNKDLTDFIDHINVIITAYAEKMDFKLMLEANAQIDIEPNSSPKARYSRLVHQEHGKTRSLYCFVDLTNGDLLKGSWKAPVKNGKRGNLFDRSTWANFNHYGPNYLR